MKVVKCKYNKCLYGGGEINDGDVVEVRKGYYMHKECARYSRIIQKIVDLYKQSVDENVIQSALYKAINTIVFDQKTDPEFLLFVLTHAINEHKKLKSPFGLYYLVKDEDEKSRWKATQAMKIISQIGLAEQKAPVDYKYTPSPPLTLNSITEGL